MPTLTTLKDGVLSVTGLPEDAENIRIMHITGAPALYYEFGNGKWKSESLPPGSWKVLGWSDELTEEQMSLLVEGNNGGNNDTMFMDYPSKEKFMCFLHRTVVPSFASLLRSHSITEKALIIVNKK